MRHLEIGHTMHADTGVIGQPFSIPLDGVTKAYAINGIRESGKSSLGTVLAEEYCKLKQPWAAFDPGGNWWGLRSKPDGKGKGFPVVVFGGERADLPLEKGMGPKIAEAIATQNVFAVIDLKLTSKTVWRTLVRDIFTTLMEITAEVPRHLFLEEAQEFIPQTASYQLGRECSEIVERMVTLGGNWGYGVTIMGQRPASISKSALSQCETVFAFATQGDHDRRALQDWMKSQKVGPEQKAALENLADLPTGQCYVWSPRFLQTFGRLQIRRRETLHPREARKNGMAMRDIELVPVDEFVATVRKQLTKVQETVTAHLAPGASEKTKRAVGKMAQHVMDQPPRVARVEQQLSLDANAFKVVQLEEQLKACRADIDRERALRMDAERRLAIVRDHLKPTADMYRSLFDALTPAGGAVTAHDPKVYAPFLQKAGRAGCKRMLELLIEKGQLTKTQLGTLAGVPSTRRTFRTYMSWLRSNNLVDVDGDQVKLKAV